VLNQCYSACVFVVAGGVNRTATSSARIGVHQFYFADRVDSNTATSDAQQISSIIIQYLQASGVNPDLFHEMVKVPPTEIRVIPTERLVEWHLLSYAPMPSNDDAKTGAVPIPTEKRLVFEARDMVGGDSTSQKGLTQNECEATCRFDSLCKGYTYDKWNKLCLLKSGNGILRVEPRSVTVVLSGLTPRESGAPFQILKKNGKAFPDAPYRTPMVNGYDQCAQFCTADVQCLGINYRESSGICEMIARPSEYSSRAGVSLGVKSQQATVQ